MAEIPHTTEGTPSERAPLLLTHGFGASRAMWSANIGRLAADREVCAWDLPGHGENPAVGVVSHERCVEEMTALLDRLGTQRAVLGGMSLGGYLSLLFCARHPERVAALVLVDTGPGFRDDEAREGWNRWARDLADELESRGLAALRPGPESAAAEHLQGAAGLAAAARGILTQRDGEVLDSLGGVSVPTLVVVGAEDERFLAAAEVMGRRIPDASKVVIEGAGHAANMDRPDEFNDAVETFLREL
jgi:pimeloyl-ACP methyl ester carboxylesterase